jgi:RecB family exonuclease
VDTWLKAGEPAGDIILDYKTGSAKPTAWEGERPDAPQLPLYAVVAGSPELSGVAFASVRSGNSREIRGFAAQQGVLPRASVRDLESQVQQWRATLTSLAEEFHAGRVEVRPKQYPETCKYCEQRLLCRLDISSLTADEMQEEEASEEENG